MEKKKTLGEMLREKREQLGHGQQYIYTKLNMTQPAYSFIENGKVRISPKLVQEINLITGFEDFHQSGAASAETSRPETLKPRRQTLASRWPWNKFLLVLLVIVSGILLADPLFQVGLDFYRGDSGINELDKDAVAPFAVIYFVLYALLIWWIVFKQKW